MKLGLTRIFAAVLVYLAFYSGSSSFAAAKLIEKIESPYSSIFVYKSGNYIKMLFGNGRLKSTESVYNPLDKYELPVPYTRFMTAGLFYTKDVKRILVIGLGGGRISWYLHEYLPQVDITAIEIDPMVIDVARRYFDVANEENFRVVEKDGRSFLMQAKEKYDLILLDAYRSSFVPFHLLTREFYTLVKARLAKNGIVGQNINPASMLFESTVATMTSVFDSADFYDAKGNVVAIGYDGARRTSSGLERRARQLQSTHRFRYPLPEMPAKRRFFTPPDKIKPLTDDFAPVNSLKAITRHNRKWDR